MSELVAPVATPSVTPSVTEWLDGLRELAGRELAPVASAYEVDRRFPRQLLETLAARGLVALGAGRPDLVAADVPDVAGAEGHLLFLDAVEVLAAAWLAPAESVHLQVLAMRALARHGSPDLVERYLAPMARFEVVGGNCFSEPETGSDLSELTTRAEDRGDHYVVTGTKTWVGHGPVADVLNIYCRTGGPGATGISCLFVDVATDGVVVGPPMEKMGARSLPNARIELRDVRVPKDRLLGRPGRGLLVASDVFQAGRLGLAACANGLTHAALTHAAAYAKERRQFGRRVLDFQGVSFLLADVATQLAASRALLRTAAAPPDPRAATLLAAQAKLFASDTAMRATTDAVQVLGAAGYGLDRPVERYMREAKLLQIIEGTNQIQRATIASYL